MPTRQDGVKNRDKVYLGKFEKKKLLRPDYFQVQFVEKIFTLLFNTEIIYRDQTLMKFVY